VSTSATAIHSSGTAHTRGCWIYIAEGKSLASRRDGHDQKHVHILAACFHWNVALVFMFVCKAGNPCSKGRQYNTPVWLKAQGTQYAHTRTQYTQSYIVKASPPTRRYATVATHAPPCWLADLTASALRSLMDLVFVSAVAPLPALHAAWVEVGRETWRVLEDAMSSVMPQVGHGAPLSSMPQHQQHQHHHHHLLQGSFDHRQQQHCTRQQQQHQHQHQHDQQHLSSTQTQQQEQHQHDHQYSLSTRPQAAARMLHLLGHLQFCRLQLPMLTGLVQHLVGEVVQHPEGCKVRVFETLLKRVIRQMPFL